MDHANVHPIEEHEWENIKLMLLMTGLTFEEIMSAINIFLHQKAGIGYAEDKFNGH